jgi:CheY-like chemotaxis protein
MNGPIDVLVVDDERVVCDVTRLVLESAGWRVGDAPDAATALAHPGLATCRIVLCDVMLRHGSGLDVARAIRQRLPDLPIVMITGYATSAIEAQCMEAGATALLPKPFDDSELLAIVHRVLDAQPDVARKEAVP